MPDIRDSPNFEAFAKISFELVNKFKDEEFMMKKVVLLIAESLYRTPAIPSGFISQDAFDGKGQKTKEHFFSRNQSAKTIVDEIIKGKSLNRIICLFKSRSRCHITTQEENKALIQYQKSRDYDYKYAYSQVVSPLILNEKYVYIIEGKEFINSKEVSKKYNITTTQVNSRCGAKTKWKDWIRNERY